MGMMPMNAGMGNPAMPTPAGNGNMAPATNSTAVASTMDTAAAEVKSSSSAPAKPPRQSRRSAEESENLADIEIGTRILVKYQHPSRGRIKFEGDLVEKEIDGTNHDSFIQLQDVKQLSATGKIKGQEESKKLMFAFINQVRLVKKESPEEAATASE